MIVCACLLTLLAGLQTARADRLDRVRHDRLLRCGAEPRSQVAEATATGLSGAAVQLCRGVAVALAGPHAAIAFRLYDSDRAFEAVRLGGDDLFFLSPDAIADAQLATRILPGPVVLRARLSLMVAQPAAARRPQDLAGATICFMVGSDAQRALDAAFRAWRLDFVHMAFEEDVEMLDAYGVRRCAAMAGEATELARMRRSPGVIPLDSRILPQPLATFPIIAATPVGDLGWSERVGRALAKLLPAPASDGPPASPQVGQVRQQAGK